MQHSKVCRSERRQYAKPLVNFKALRVRCVAGRALNYLVAFQPADHKFAKAVMLYTRTIEENPKNAVYYSNRAFAHTKLENYGAAVEDATKAIELDPEYLKVRLSS